MCHERHVVSLESPLARQSKVIHITTKPITARYYHERTKHQRNGYAAGPGRLDWEDQPEPFRDYGDCLQIPLPLNKNQDTPFSELAAGQLPDAKSLDLSNLGILLSNSMAISAWKSYGPSRWALRCNPSSGNLHPTETYLALPNCDGISSGLYHYRPQDHRLEQRCAYSNNLTSVLFNDIPENGFLLGLSSIPWREAWKYGERAWRYCLLDLGHAVAALRYAAALLGWTVTPLSHLSDSEAATLLGLDRDEEFIAEEPEYPEMICLITPADQKPENPYLLPNNLESLLSESTWQGKANRLSNYHNHQWDVIDHSIVNAQKGRTSTVSTSSDVDSPPLKFDTSTSVVELIQRRRSAQAFDGVTGLTRQQFFTILDHTLPRTTCPPWGEETAWKNVHLILFVHLVADIPTGLYALLRRPQIKEALVTAMHNEFEWAPVDEAPEHLPLYRLLNADTKDVARQLACMQDIASDGAFSIAMLGEFEQTLAMEPEVYRNLMTEAGMIGQTLYLGAEACNIQGTGIGCFFDDGLHKIFGLEGQQFQVLYQFTLGKGLMDNRITTEPPYPDLTSEAR